MVSRILTIALDAIDAQPVMVEAQIVPSSQHTFSIVGLPDKAVAESRERVRAAFASIGLSLPWQRIVVNLSPADQRKEGSHYDVPIALCLLQAMGVFPADALQSVLAIGELGLSGDLARVPGALPAAMTAQRLNLTLICPRDCGPEAAWSGAQICAPSNLMALIAHLKGDRLIEAPTPGAILEARATSDMADIRGQELAKRALEIAAAGGHNLILCGAPGAGKTMLAQRLIGILPPLSARELLDVSMIQSVAGLLERGALTRARPFRAPHHSASMAALVGGGVRAKPGEVSLAHLGVLFLDELPEFHQQALDALRQPLEDGIVTVARANHHVTYPARVQLIGAMNPCRCAAKPGACRRGPQCADAYQARLSGPLLDRVDLFVDVDVVAAADLLRPATGEKSAVIAERVAKAREAQHARFDDVHLALPQTNASIASAQIDAKFNVEPEAAALLTQAAEAFSLSARGYHRALRVARTIADLEQSDNLRRRHVAEALSFRRRAPSAAIDLGPERSRRRNVA